MRSGLVLYRLVFFAGNGEADGEISGVAARGRSGSAARSGNADIFVRNFYRPRKKREWERGFSAADTRGCCLSGVEKCA